MKCYKYVGTDPFLIGEEAIGRMIDGVFKIQVHRFNHPWSHGWHETLKEDWEILESEDESC
jgi:hypothetical protein